MQREAVQTELEGFFELLEIPCVTDSAFTQARKKLSPFAFAEVNHTIVEQYYRAGKYKTWHGHRLLGIDGSTLNVTDADEHCRLFFHLQNSTGGKGKGYSVARLSLCHDLLNNLIIDAGCEHFHASERKMALSHAEKVLIEGDLIILDRGYPGFTFFSQLLSRGVDICARISLSFWKKQVAQLLESGEDELIIDVEPSDSQQEECREAGVEPNTLRLRFIKVILDTGEIEVLVTSLLNTQKYPVTEFKELYHMRWVVEEAYKQLKKFLKLTKLTGKSATSVLQDFYAAVLLKNITDLMAMSVDQELKSSVKRRKKRKAGTKKGERTKRPQYKVNRCQGFITVKDYIVRLMTCAVDEVEALIMKLNNRLRRSVTSIRPDRKFERKMSRKGKENLKNVFAYR